MVDLPEDLSTTEWIGETMEVSMFESDKVRDLVQSVRLKDGGIISYHRPDGSVLHTLNDLDGSAREIQQLGISMEPGKTST